MGWLVIESLVSTERDLPTQDPGHSAGLFNPTKENLFGFTMPKNTPKFNKPMKIFAFAVDLSYCPKK